MQKDINVDASIEKASLIMEIQQQSSTPITNKNNQEEFSFEIKKHEYQKDYLTKAITFWK